MIHDVDHKMLLVMRSQKPLCMYCNQNGRTIQNWDELRASVINKESPMGCVTTSSDVATSTHT